MSLILKKKLSGPDTWLGSELVSQDSWRYSLSEKSVEIFQSALAQTKALGKRFPDMDKSDFPLGELKGEFDQLADELESGRGFVVIKGFPVHEWTSDDLDIINYGFGLYLGEPVYQNLKGDLLGKVMNVGDLSNKETRVYETNAYLPYHTDLSDVFGLMCIRKARSGGMTSLVSTSAVYNEILEHYPEYLGIFYRPMCYAHLGKDNTSKAPIFSYFDGKLSCRYLRQYIELGHELQNQTLSRIEIEALDIFDNVIHDPKVRLDMMLEPGDMLLANNYSVMHSRTGFEDFDEPERRRKLIRLWVKMPNARALAPDFPGQNGFPAPDAQAPA